MHPWGPRSLGWTQALVLMVTVVVALGALSSTFSTIFITFPEDDGQDDFGFGDLTLDEWPSDFREVFTIHQVGDQRYFRCEVLLEYRDGRWAWEEGDTETYQLGYWMGSTPFENQYADIKPLVRWEGALPIAKDTRYLAWESSVPMDWNPSLEVMRSREVVDKSYHIRYLGYPVLSLEEYRGATVTPDAELLTVPDGLAHYVRELAEAFAAEQDTPYDRALAIRDRLRSDYRYTFNLTKAPEGTDPLYWFLLGSYEGVCTHFNSAMVLMARSLGIPARLVSGYLINSDLEYQTIYAKQAHAFAEIRLDGIGWVIMDATPLAPPDVYEVEDANKFTIRGKVYHDAIPNGVVDPIEESLGLENVLIRIIGPNAISEVLRTDRNGMFSYTGPSVGVYTVLVQNQDSWVAYSPVERSVTLGVSEMTRLEFGYTVRNTGGEHGAYDLELLRLHGGPVQNRSDPWFVDCILRDRNGTALSSTNEIYAYLEPRDVAGDRVLIGSMVGQFGYFLEGNICRMECVLPKSLEAGNYTLIVRWAGDEVNAPTEDNSTVKVMGDVRISLSVPRFVMPDSPATATVRLFDSETGKDLSPANVTLDPGNGTYVELNVLPSMGGRIVFSATLLGAYEMVCEFAGNELFRPAQATATYKVEYPRFVMALPDLVRGKNNSLYGRMLLGDIPIAGAMVSVEIEDLLSLTVVSDSLGEVTIFVPVPGNSTLSRRDVTFDSGTFHSQSDIAVVSTTRMTVVQEGGMVLANLTDDQGAPLPGAAVSFAYDGRSVSALTGDDGVASIRMDADGPVNCRAAFEGNGTHLTSYGNVTFVPVVQASQWIWLPLVLAGTMAVIGTLLVLRRRRVRTSPFAPTFRKREPAEGLLVKGPHDLAFPDIEHGMPWVWHGGRLRLVVRTPDASISLLVDGLDTPIEVVQGRAETSLELGDGRHVLEVEGPSGRTVAAVRMVEYRKEVLDLFARSLERWSPSAKVAPQMSPREVFFAIGGAAYLVRADALGTIERAAYSHHPVARADYKAVLETLREMGGLV